VYVPLGSPAEFCETASEPSEPIAAVPAVDAQPHENCTVPPSSDGCEAYDAVNAGELDGAGDALGVAVAPTVTGVGEEPPPPPHAANAAAQIAALPTAKRERIENTATSECPGA